MTVLEIGALVCTRLKEAGIDVFLSGGAVVSIYTSNRYESHDLDFITYGDFKKIETVMIALGFNREKGRHFLHPNTEFFVEFPGNAATIGDEPIREFSEIKTSTGLLKLLTPTYCVMDRLSSFYFWNDPQGLEQAVMVAKAHPFNLSIIEKWSKREKLMEQFSTFVKRVRN